MTLTRVPLVGLLLAVAACTSVRSIHPATYIPAHRPLIVWVTFTDNSFVPVARPRIMGDTLSGIWEGLQESISIPLGQVQTVQAKLPDYTRTFVLFSTLAAVVGGIMVANRSPR